MSKDHEQQVATTRTGPVQVRESVGAAADQPEASPLTRLGRLATARLLNLREMSAGLRIVTIVGIALIVCSGGLVVAHDLVGDSGAFAATSGLTVDTQSVPVANILIYAAFIISVFGGACLLTGALHSHPVIAVIGLVAFTLVDRGNTLSMPYMLLAGRPTQMEAMMEGVGSMPLLGLVSWGVFVQLERARARRKGMGTASSLIGWTFVCTFGLLILIAWLPLSSIFVEHDTSFLAATLNLQGMLVFFMAIPVFFLATTDLMEAADSALLGAVAGVQRLKRLNTEITLACLLVIAACAGLVLIFFPSCSVGCSPVALGLKTAEWLVLAVPVTVCLFAIVQLGRPGGNISGPIPLAVLLLFAIISSQSALYLSPFRHGIDLSTGLLVGIFLLALGRLRHQPSLSMGGAFACTFGLYTLFAYLPNFLTSWFGIPATTPLLHIPGTPYTYTVSGLQLNLYGFVAVASVVSLSILVTLAARGQLTTPKGASLLRTLLALTGGFLALVMLDIYYGRTNTSSSVLGIQAALLVIAFLWDLLTSGAITNRSSRVFPRNIRVLLYLGYSLLLTFSAVLSLGAQNALGANALATGSSAASVDYGLVTLGVPFLLAVALQRVWQGPDTQLRVVPGVEVKPEQTHSNTVAAPQLRLN